MKPKAEISKAGVLQLLAVPVPISQIADLYKVRTSVIEAIQAEAEKEQLRQQVLAQAGLRAASGARPFPSTRLLDQMDHFEPAPELQDWATKVFLTPGGPLYNPTHDHLVLAIPCFQWTTLEYRKGDMLVAGMAEIPSVQGNKWLKGRMEQQLVEWFDEVPQFLITLHAETAAGMSDIDFCELVEHELTHCAQAKTKYGDLAYTQEGLPRYGMRGHDVEDFVEMRARYGQGSGKILEYIQAANSTPIVGEASIQRACGSCR